MIISFIKSYVATAYVSVNINFRSATVGLKVIRNKSILKTEEKTFHSVGFAIPIDIIKYIRQLQKDYRIVYVSGLNYSSSQGIIANTNDFDANNQNTSSIMLKNKWIVYSLNEDIREIRAHFDGCDGVDFIYSPFALLYHLYKNKFTNNARLYVLLQKSILCVLILKSNTLLYSNVEIIESDDMDSEEDYEEQEEQEEVELEEQTQEQDNFDLNLDEDLDDIDDMLEEKLEDLDDLDDIDTEDIKNDESFIDKLDSTEMVDGPTLKGVALHKTSKILDALQIAISDFYESPQCKSDFVESILIADDDTLDQESYEYLKSSLLMDIELTQINVSSLMNEVSIKETKK